MKKPQNDGIIVNLTEEGYMDTSTGAPRADIVLCGLQHITTTEELRRFADAITACLCAFYDRHLDELEKRHAQTTDVD